jgi:hypothetical protein
VPSQEHTCRAATAGRWSDLTVRVCCARLAACAAALLLHRSALAGRRVSSAVAAALDSLGPPPPPHFSLTVQWRRTPAKNRWTPAAPLETLFKFVFRIRLLLDSGSDSQARRGGARRGASLCGACRPSVRAAALDPCESVAAPLAPATTQHSLRGPTDFGGLCAHSYELRSHRQQRQAGCAGMGAERPGAFVST